MTTPLPPVAVVCPTFGRPEMHAQLARIFALQDYRGPLRLIVLDDSPEPSAFFERIVDPHVIYMHRTQRMSIGAKRNALCDLARTLGDEIIVQFDDDDLYSPAYVSTMVDALLKSGADLVKLSVFDIRRQIDGTTWRWDTRVTDGVQCVVSGSEPVVCAKVEGREEARDFALYGYGFSYVFRTSMLDRARFPDMDRGEDYAFIRAAIDAGARVQFVDDRPDLVLHTVHPASTSRSFPQQRLDGPMPPVQAASVGNRLSFETGETYVVVAVVKSEHTDDELKLRAGRFGLEVIEVGAVRMRAPAGYRALRAVVRAHRNGELPSAVPAPLSWFDQSHIVTATRTETGSSVQSTGMGAQILGFEMQPRVPARTGLGPDLDAMLTSSPQWGEIQKQMEVEGQLPFAIESAKALFITSYREMNTQRGIEPSVAIETAKQFVGSDRTLQGALQGVEGLLSVAQGHAPPSEVVQQFTTVIIGAAVTAGVVVPGVGAMIAVGIAVTLAILKSVGLFGNESPGEDICGVTFRPPPAWTVGCVGMYGERVPGPKNDGWRKFPAPGDPEWFFQPTVDAWGHQVSVDPIFGRRQKIGAAFPAYHRLQCDLNDAARQIAGTAFPQPVREFYLAFYTAWKSNIEYALNGLKASADWEVFLHTLRLWNRTHSNATTFVFEARDNDIDPNTDQDCLSRVPYIAIMVSDIRKKSGNPEGDAPNHAIQINTGPRKDAPKLIRLRGITRGIVGGAGGASASSSTSGTVAKGALIISALAAGGVGVYAWRTHQNYVSVWKKIWNASGGRAVSGVKKIVKKVRR